MEPSKPGYRMTEEGQEYAFEPADVEICRLNLQYYTWKDALGFDIHPSIPTSSSMAIADAATGTSIWAIQVARQYPQAQLDCSDIDLSQAPHKRWLPKNVALRHWDMVEEPPDDMLGKYDLVHVRLLVVVADDTVADRTPSAIARKLYRLLKPGGFLQWDELNTVDLHVKRADPARAAPALEGICEMTHGGGRYAWALELPRLLADEGFAEAKLEHYDVEDVMVHTDHKVIMVTMDRLARGLIKFGNVESGEHLLGLVRSGQREVDDRAAVCFPKIVCVARKPC